MSRTDTTDAARAAVATLPGALGDDQWLRLRHASPGQVVRDASVLMLFGRGTAPRTPAGREELDRLDGLGVADVDVLLLQRSSKLRHHPGQVAFPGGRVDPEDTGPVDAALREAVEETGLDTTGVEMLGTMEPLFIPVSRFEVTPVIAWWRSPSPVRVVDPGETASVHRIPVADLVAPANRGTFFPPDRAYSTPAFDTGVLRVWGFTAGLLEYALDHMGWAREWNRDAYVHIEL
ncbi:NUDIX hydrolase [Brevibacterium litoralis]|uniref:NUDIX hydrolase n=1 Tax=Brevibacterium litoralis TaxID=3138935 RepID=UPI0032ECCF79